MALHPGAPFTLFGIPHCDSVKRARAWFAALAGAAPVFHDFKQAGLPAPALDAWVAAVGWERVLNRRGSTWRALDDAARAAVVDASSAKRAMLAQPSLVIASANRSGSTASTFEPPENTSCTSLILDP